MAQYDANVKVNVTIEYPYGGDSVLQSDIKADLRAAFEAVDITFGGVHIWVTEALSTGRPSYIDG